MVSDKESRFSYGMSKMTVKDEVKNRAEYEKLRFVEFLEFIGRIAYAKYIDDDFTNAEKVEKILDDIF